MIQSEALFRRVTPPDSATAPAAIATMREREGLRENYSGSLERHQDRQRPSSKALAPSSQGAQRTRRLRIASRFGAWVTVTHRLRAVLGETGRTQQQRERLRTSPTPSRRGKALSLPAVKISAVFILFVNHHPRKDRETHDYEGDRVQPVED
jgi:hypothetical protein